MPAAMPEKLQNQLKPAGSRTPAWSSILGDGWNMIPDSEVWSIKDTGLQHPAVEVTA